MAALEHVQPLPLI
uniref:Uncharacterized protein n=1 Tax=Arundo donax TaxID=35708 RepID=A0A0A8ZXB7_ARUDO